MMKHRNSGRNRHDKKQVRKSTLLMEMAEDIMDLAMKARKYRKLRDRDREEID